MGLTIVWMVAVLLGCSTAVADHGVGMLATVLLDGSAPVPLPLLGERTEVAVWQFQLGYGEFAYVGGGNEHVGFFANSMLCCEAGSIEIGPLTSVETSAGGWLFNATFRHCANAFCHSGSVQGFLATEA